MLIGIEAERANHPNPTGVEHYTKQLILALARIDKQNSYILYLRNSPQPWFLELPANFKIKTMPFPIFWTQLRISWEMLWHPVDVLFITASALPIIHPENSVVTIHDLAWIYFPETFTPFMRFYLKFSCWYACKTSKKIIAVSEQTKKDLISKYNLEQSKITVIYHGFDAEQEQAEQQANSEEAERIGRLPQNFILYLGTLQPRKNIIGLIDAYIALKESGNIANSLVIAGGKGWLYDQIMEKIKSRNDIIYFGYVRDRFELLKKAALLVLPSFYEGFGMTVLDAFAAGVPVACSNVSSVPEVAGNAAEYFDPKSKESIISALSKILGDPEKQKLFIARGKERLKLFSWLDCAKKSLAVLLE